MECKENLARYDLCVCVCVTNHHQKKETANVEPPTSTLSFLREKERPVRMPGSGDKGSLECHDEVILVSRCHRYCLEFGQKL